MDKTCFIKALPKLLLFFNYPISITKVNSIYTECNLVYISFRNNIFVNIHRIFQPTISVNNEIVEYLEGNSNFKGTFIKTRLDLQQLQCDGVYG